MLLYATHFSSLVTVYSRNGLISFCLDKVSRIGIQCLFFYVLLCVGPKFHAFFKIQLCTNGLKLFLLAIFNSQAMLQLLTCQTFSIIFMILSTFSMSIVPVHLTLKILERIGRNQNIPVEQMPYFNIWIINTFQPTGQRLSF